TDLNNSTKPPTSSPYLLSSEVQHSSFQVTSSSQTKHLRRKPLLARQKKSNVAQWKRFSLLSTGLDENQSKCRAITPAMTSSPPTDKATSTTSRSKAASRVQIPLRSPRTRSPSPRPRESDTDSHLSKYRRRAQCKINFVM